MIVKRMKHFMILVKILLISGSGIVISVMAGDMPGVQLPPPDTRVKADILLVVAHPDDETAVGSYLAKAIFDDNRKVAVVYTNRGSGGGNSHGREQSLSMGLIRETEVRRALAEFGIFNVWFLDGTDTPGQDLFHSLRNLHHGRSLEQLVRIVRLTRPEIIFTWLPCYSSGENHGDHQAAGVIATEAFDLAGDPTKYPVQVAVPRERMDIDNHNEGLIPWQPKRLYFFSDRNEPFPAPGPVFDITSASLTQKIPYVQLGARLSKHHLTQGEVANSAIEAHSTNDWESYINWMERYRLIFGKSHVPCRTTDPVFTGISSRPIDYHSPQGYLTDQPEGIVLKTGGVFDFYRKFLKAHDLDHLSGRIPPEVTVAYGSYVHFPLIIENHSPCRVSLQLDANYPEGWTEVAGSGDYSLETGESIPVQTFSFAPEKSNTEDHTIRWNLKTGKTILKSIDFHVHLAEWALPQ